jgi:pyruvate/2-oxoglutarate dehydrogenase complex dihydrolipoamide dehydrogenase (E3) component
MPLIYKRLLKQGLAFRLNSWLSRVDTEAAHVLNLYTGDIDEIRDFDTVVLCTGSHADGDLYFELKKALPNVHRVGDCVAPRRLDHAIYEGYVAGRELWDREERHFTEGTLESWDSELAAV